MQYVHKKGFTLIELLVVIAIIAILGGLLLPAVNGVKKKGYEARAKSELKGIETAVKAYANEYSKLPVDDAEQGLVDVETTETQSKAVIMRLSGDNPRKILFLESDAVDGTYLDPWKNQYKMFLDANYDNEITVNNETKRTQVIVYSDGPDGSTNKIYSFDL